MARRQRQGRAQGPAARLTVMGEPRFALSALGEGSLPLPRLPANHATSPTDDPVWDFPEKEGRIKGSRRVSRRGMENTLHDVIHSFIHLSSFF